jgi:hypothetical protein
MTTTNDTNSTQRLAVPRRQEIGDVAFFLDRDGRLTIDERPHGQPLVKLTPGEAFALLTFVRQPGVAELIEQAEAARQEQQWRDYEPDPETIAERTAGR